MKRDKQHGNAGSTAGLESADTSSESNDRLDTQRRLRSRAFDLSQEAEKILVYGRRQEAEEAHKLLAEANRLYEEASALG